MTTLHPFHLAFPVHELEAARGFYGELLGSHLAPDETRQAATNAVDGDQVPVRHFGVVLPMGDWHALAERLRGAGVSFVIEPDVRFHDQPGEQATMFFLDPSGNALEFKACRDIASLFAK